MKASLLLSLAATATGLTPARAEPRPNIVFILTDDQDLRMGSLDYQPYVKRHLIERGTFYRRHYCTVAICCPSRVSLWTGKAAHNTNVTDVSPPYGGYPKFISQGLNDNYLPVWLQQSGYNTYYTGKLFNAHSVNNYDKPFPAGFNGSDFLLDPFTYQYLNSTFQRNQEPPVNHAGEYSTDLVAEKALGFLADAAHEPEPFFLAVAPVACHSNTRVIDDQTAVFDVPIPAKRHENLFADVVVPRTENFNPDKPSGVNWVKELPKLNDTVVEYNDDFYRARLRTLQAVDEIVDQVISRLEDYGILNNTYIIYSSDNGFHIGQHRLHPGKECGFEEDINIPLIIRGPGIPENKTTDIVTTHTDLSPTILKLIGAPTRPDFDGLAIPVTENAINEAEVDRFEHVNVEYWGYAIGEGIYGIQYLNNTYKAVRVIGKDYNFYYSVWCNNEHELYDLNNDPYQLNNLFPLVQFTTTGPQNIGYNGSGSQIILGYPLSSVVNRLDSLLLVLKSCKGEVCIRPWEALHPAGNVQSLSDALSPIYDRLYESQPRVEFTRCENGYILDAEGPQFQASSSKHRYGARLQDWV